MSPLTFTSLGGAAVRCDTSKTSIAAFPSGESKAKLTLLPQPEEKPSEGKISWPGEYDMEGVAIRGIGHGEGNQISYVLEIEGARCAFISSPLQEWTDYGLELLGDVDILVIPTDDEKIVQKIIDEVDPRVVIPLPTKDEGTFESVLKFCGAQNNEIEGEYKTRGSFPAEGREVHILKPKKG